MFTFTFNLIGNFRIAMLCLLTVRQRTTQIQFMLFDISPLEIQLPLRFLSRTRFLTNLQCAAHIVRYKEHQEYRIPFYVVQLQETAKLISM